MKSNPYISHSWQDESLESKARWYRSLSMPDRMQVFCDLTDLVLSVQPRIQDKRHAQSAQGRVRIISAA